MLLLAPVAAATVCATYRLEATLAARRDARTRLEAEALRHMHIHILLTRHMHIHIHMHLQALRHMRGVKAHALEETLECHVAEARHTLHVDT